MTASCLCLIPKAIIWGPVHFISSSATPKTPYKTRAALPKDQTTQRKNAKKPKEKQREGREMDKFMDSVGSIFRGGDVLPWCDRDIIAGFESEIAEASNEEQKNDSLMRLSWALVHSRQPEDVNRGVGMLQASLDRSSSPLQTREKLYLLAVGHYRTGDYTRSRQLLERCLEIQPDWRQALTLQRLVEEKTRRDGMIGMAIITGAFGVVGLVAGGIIAAASSSRKK